MSNKVSCEWKGGMAFEADVTGHTIVMDADASSGGNDTGSRPKPLLLAALGGCSGMDVVSILKKMQEPLTWFNMEIEGQAAEEHPRYYTEVTIVYQFKKGDGLDEAKVEKAVRLSQERYCGVSAQLSKGAQVNWRIEYLE
ncbi:OsmC family protein [Sediminispirochaeta smaragdinae]|uniref:OsmC family protein n=1 Tax=Sediminispirochaeta smaragdinae (strain DSM 11293 / JCM 15392 / SEBR 4228) TaxID=573413 RepID=E1R570_SEDSS|nr:OsmC family protein [Sediminispirochaeta smaragdinae]ADK80605.1 OsmC family protein [Sediminispirochaeta smaragdinae DSM 11293]